MAERGRRPARRFVRAAEAGWPPLLSQIRDVRDGWNRAADGLTANDAPQDSLEGEWGPWHVLNHVAGYLEAATTVLRSLTAGESVDYPRAQKWLGDEVSFSELNAALCRGWEEYVNALEAAAGSPDTAATVTHVLAGTMTVREWTALGVYHLTEHVDQLGELRRKTLKV
jgi:hypothetical protein